MNNNKPVLVVEHCLDGLKLNENASVGKKNNDIVLTGVFTEFDVKNRNERIYTKDRFLPHLNEMKDRMNNLGAVYGEFDHPDVFDTSLARVSHVIKDVTFNESENRIDGSIQLLNTHYGREAQALVESGLPIFVSSRAAGVTESDGTVTIKKLFTYDAVADPGFASTRMNVKVMNESLGFNESANFRIFDMTDESKFNELYEMNKQNENVTRDQMEEYSQHLTQEMVKIKEDIEKNIKQGNNPSELHELSEKYETLMENFNKVTSYLDYLADNMQFMVNENKSLKEKTNNLVKHNDYLAENLEKSINYSNYLSDKVNENVNYSEYIAKKLDESIQFSEYIAENTNKAIEYSDYLAEQLDNNIQYSEYLAEHAELNIKENENLREYVDNTVNYAEYLAENIDNNIKYSKYLAENVDNHIKYSEYIANELNDTQAYSKYIAESLDNTITTVNESKLNENVDMGDQAISDMQVTNVDKYYNDEQTQDFPPENDDVPSEISDVETEVQVDVDGDGEAQVQVQVEAPEGAEIVTEPETEIEEEPYEPMYDETILGQTVKVETDEGEVKTGEVLSYNSTNGIAVVELTPEDAVETEVQPDIPVQTEETDVQVETPVEAQADVQAQVQPQAQVQAQPQAQEIEIHESKITLINKDNKLVEKEESIKESISQLIKETKKRKATEDAQPHFLLFLTKENQEYWKSLSTEDKEKVIVTMNESNYTTEAEVLNIIREAVSTPSKSDEQILVESIPNDLVEVWNGLNDTVKKNVLAQAKFYPNLTKSDAKMESFWNTRNFEMYSINESKTVISEKKNFIDDSKLPQKQIDAYINKFKNL